MRLPSVAALVRDQKLRFYERRHEDFRATLEAIVEVYGDDRLEPGEALARTFDLASSALAGYPLVAPPVLGSLSADVGQEVGR